MAERRMFAKSIVQSGRFLKMPVSSRELYFQMGMMADDDGVVEAWNALKITNANEDDLRVLISKGYVHILDNEDMIAYLSDWETNNQIRKDRYHQGAYKELKVQILQGIEILDNQMTTICQPNDNQMTTEVSIGKYSLGKDSIEKKDNTTCYQKKTSTRFVPPTVEEVMSYCAERNNGVDAERFIDYYEARGWMIGKNKMKDWKAAVRTWERNNNSNTHVNTQNDSQRPKYDLYGKLITEEKSSPYEE